MIFYALAGREYSSNLELEGEDWKDGHGHHCRKIRGVARGGFGEQFIICHFTLFIELSMLLDYELIFRSIYIKQEKGRHVR